METYVKKIKSIQFGILSESDIRKMSVVEVNTSKFPAMNSVYDPRMGPMKLGETCVTCSKKTKDCPGHFGHIELSENIIHPLYYRTVLDFLKFFCINCSSLLASQDNIKLWKMSKLRGASRFENLKKKFVKLGFCSQCSCIQPKYTFSPPDNTYYVVYKNSIEKIPFGVVDITRIFSKIRKEDIDTIGINSDNCHPMNFILSVLPVIPPRARPFIMSDNVVCDDDLTITYIEILKINNSLKSSTITVTKRQKYVQNLIFRIKSLFDNSTGKAKHTNMRPIKGIKERLCGKDGIIRSNLLGKRCLDPETPVLMWNGSVKPAKDISIEDELIGDDGKRRIVKNITKGKDMMYRINQSNGDSYIVNEEHILCCRFSDHLKISSRRGNYKLNWVENDKITSQEFHSHEEAIDFSKTLPKNNMVNISVKDFLQLSQYTQSRLRGCKLNIPVSWKSQDVDLDPYIMGMWLGDGNSIGYGFTSADEELVECWKTWAKKYDMNIVKHRNSDIHYNVSGNKNFMNALRKYNLLKNKHIPMEYILNDEDMRLKLLAGLIDTTGFTLPEKTTITISQGMKNAIIIYQAQYIARSLGFRASIRKKRTTWIHNGIKKYGEALRLTISGKLSKLPIVLERKKGVDSKYETTYYKIQVEKLGVGSFCGFELDGNRKFLLGDFTITHNCDFSARTVIGPDPYLKINEIAIPPEIAQTLTYPERVNDINKEFLQKLVWEDKANVVIRGKTKYILKYALAGDKRYNFKIQNNDIVERQLRDGDIIILNRRVVACNRCLPRYYGINSVRTYVTSVAR